MTVTDIITAATDIYNASGDSFFTQAQFFNWIWQAQHELAKKAWLIERKYSTSTVNGTQDYVYPTNTIAVKRVTVNGKKIKRITHRQDDAITLSNAAVQTSGYPIYYTDFNFILSLRPIPDGVYTLQVFSYNDASQITSVSTALDIPQLFHFDVVDYCLWRMFSKDKDLDSVIFYRNAWIEHVKDAVSYKNRLKRTDSYATVQSEDILPVNILGEQ